MSSDESSDESVCNEVVQSVINGMLMVEEKKITNTNTHCVHKTQCKGIGNIRSTVQNQ